MIYQLLLIVCGAKYIRPPSMFPGNVKDGVPFDRALSALREVIRRLNRKTSASNSSLDCTDFERQCGMHISSHGPRIMDDCLPSEGGWGYVFRKNEVMGFDPCRRLISTICVLLISTTPSLQIHPVSLSCNLSFSPKLKGRSHQIIQKKKKANAN